MAIGRNNPNDKAVFAESFAKILESRRVSSASRFRQALPQFLACMAKNVVIFDLGMAIGYPTIVIPVLLGFQADRNPDEIIHMTPAESTWVGSLLFLAEPLGSISAGWITEQLGRKRSLMLVNIPHIAAWTLLYFATAAHHVFMASALLGLGIGLLGSPVAVYVGEISHPSIRGGLLSLSNICKTFGVFVMFLLGSVMAWRSAALLALAFPLLAIAAIACVPETPHWLIAHDRPADALRSLRWLRGWVTDEEVAEEYASLTAYIARVDACETCRAQRPAPRCEHRSTYMQKIRDLCRPKTLRPFGMLVLMFFSVQFTGNQATRPYLVQIFTMFRLPLDVNWASVIVGLFDLASGTLCIFAIPMFGKRPLFLVCLVGVAICSIAIAANAYVTFDLDTSSFESGSDADAEPLPKDNYMALVLFVALGAFANIVNAMPWVMSSEVFPFRIRGTCSGLASGCSYMFIFLATKTYINIEASMSVFGAFLFYGAVTIVAFLALYQILPETEKRTLEEIEYYYSDDQRKWNDRHIPKRSTAEDEDDAQSIECGIDNKVFRSEDFELIEEMETTKSA